MIWLTLEQAHALLGDDNMRFRIQKPTHKDADTEEPIVRWTFDPHAPYGKGASYCKEDIIAWQAWDAEGRLK